VYPNVVLVGLLDCGDDLPIGGEDSVYPKAVSPGGVALPSTGEVALLIGAEFEVYPKVKSPGVLGGVVLPSGGEAARLIGAEDGV
jgi:hypothetical protein